MEDDKIVEISAFPGWLVGVSYSRTEGYRCWVINPELAVLNDGEFHASSDEAMSVGRYLVEHSLELEPDNRRYRTQD